MMLFPGQEHDVPKEYTRFIICREMGWDWETYNSQPYFFINEIIAFMSAEKEYNDIKNTKTK